MLSVLLSGSLAFDYIMNFPGYFEEHIIPDKIHVLNVSFLVDSLDRQRGGVAGNIAYTLALLGEPCKIVAPVGADFADYAEVLTGLGVDVSGIQPLEDAMTSSAFITTDRADNQITGFYPGAMKQAGQMSLLDHLSGVDMVVVSPTDPAAMERHVREAAEAGLTLVYDPGQQIISLTPQALRTGLQTAHLLFGNDYEIAMIQEKTGYRREQIVETVPVTVVTLGELGSVIHEAERTIEIPAVPAREVIDPTGAGDAYRAGLITAHRRGLPWEVAGRIGSLAATYVVESKGTQAHAFTPDEFRERFTVEFPDYASALEQFFVARAGV
jgi:adenosine kinase